MGGISLLSAICLELFYRMIVNYNNKYPSDMHYYAVTNVTDGEPHHRLLGFWFQFLYDINNNTLEINLSMALMIAAIIVVNYAAIRYLTTRDGFGSSVPRWAIQTMSLALPFMGPIYVPHIHEWYYKNTFHSFAWHSPTQQAMTFFATAAVICFIEMYLSYKEGQGVRPLLWVGVAVLTFLATSCKPSFTMNIMATVIIMFLIELARCLGENFFKRLGQLIIMGCSMIPSGLYMIWLHYSEFTEGTQHNEEHSVIFDFNHVLEYKGLWAAALFGLLFPLLVLVFNPNRIKDTKYKIALYVFVMGVLQWAFLTETGRRAKYGNFGWGRVYGTYLLMIVAATIWLEVWFDKERIIIKNEATRRAFLLISGLVLLASVFSQLNYFRLILTGNGYML